MLETLIPPRPLALGANHTCAILNDDSVKCWGNGNAGKLGQGNTLNIGDGGTTSGTPHLSVADTPAINLGGTAKAISAGVDHTCVLLDNDSVKCWGNGSDGRLGQDNTLNIGAGGTTASVADTPAINLGGTAKAISAGASNTCAVLDDDSVKCWGNGTGGKLGQGSQSAYGKAAGAGKGMGDLGPIGLGVDSAGNSYTAKAISAGREHTCALLNDDSVKCWGAGNEGKLGQGNTLNIGDGGTTSGTPHLSVADTPVIDLGVDSGSSSPYTAKAIISHREAGHVCVILNDDHIKCWGDGDNGRLGQGSAHNIGDGGTTGTTPHLSVADTPPISFGGEDYTSRAISAGSGHTCAYFSDDTMKCWGFGNQGALGQGGNTSYGWQPPGVTPFNSMEDLDPINL